MWIRPFLDYKGLGLDGGLGNYQCEQAISSFSIFLPFFIKSCTIKYCEIYKIIKGIVNFILIKIISLAVFLAVSDNSIKTKIHKCKKVTLKRRNPRERNPNFNLSIPNPKNCR